MIKLMSFSDNGKHEYSSVQILADDEILFLIRSFNGRPLIFASKPHLVEISSSIRTIWPDQPSYADPHPCCWGDHTSLDSFGYWYYRQYIPGRNSYIEFYWDLLTKLILFSDYFTNGETKVNKLVCNFVDIVAHRNLGFDTQHIATSRPSEPY